MDLSENPQRSNAHGFGSYAVIHSVKSGDKSRRSFEEEEELDLESTGSFPSEEFLGAPDLLVIEHNSRDMSSIAPSWEDSPERNPTLVKGKKYIAHVRELEDPLSPGAKFGGWGEKPRDRSRGRAGESSRRDWVPSPSRSRSPQKPSWGAATGEREYKYANAVSRAHAAELEFAAYAEATVPEPDMLPLFKLLDPNTLAGCPRKAAHARAEVFRVLREERGGRVASAKALLALEGELKELRDFAKRSRSSRAKMEKHLKESRATAAERCGLVEASESLLKSKVSALESHLVSLKGQVEAQREQNAKLTTVLATERITCSRVPGLESHISSLQRELEETKESNTTLLAKLAAEERLTLSKCGSLEQHIHTLRDELDSLRAMNSRLTMMGPPQQPPMHPQRDSVHSVDADAIAMHSQGGPQGELHQLKMQLAAEMNARECAERLTIAERVARQASEAALRDADIRERDLFSLKKRLESELEELRAALAESEGGGGRGRSRRASDGVLSVRTGVRSISRHDASEEEEEEEEDKYLYSPSGSSEGEEEEEEARTPPPARNSKKGKQLEVAERNVTDLSELVSRLRESVREKEEHIASLTRALRRARKEAKRQLMLAEKSWREENGQAFEARYIKAHEKALREERLLRRRAEHVWQHTERTLRQEVRDLHKKCGMLQHKLSAFDYLAGSGRAPCSPTHTRARSRTRSPQARARPTQRSASPSRY